MYENHSVWSLNRWPGKGGIAGIRTFIHSYSRARRQDQDGAPLLHSLASAPLPPRMRPGHVQHLCECTTVGIEFRSQAARSIRTLLTEILIPQRIPHPA